MDKQAQDLARTADHGGNLDAACGIFGGPRSAWVDLSTGINPVPYPLPELPESVWTALPDDQAEQRLIDAARALWSVPKTCAILPTNGASASIAALPGVFSGTRVDISAPTYNEHARAFLHAGWEILEAGDDCSQADVRVRVHPNNPDGRLCSATDVSGAPLILDESFADCRAEHSLLSVMDPTSTLVLKSFGKFWGLAGLRLGFAISAPDHIDRLRARLGPWAVSGPALEVGTLALSDHAWIRNTRIRLAEDAQRLDALAVQAGMTVVGGTSLFRLYASENATRMQERLAAHKIWTRIFPYSQNWIRLGLPAPQDWDRVQLALTA